MLPGRGEEGINVLFGNRVFREVELALNGAEFARRAFLGDYIDAYISDFPLARPFIPHPNIGKPFGIDGIKFEITADKPLETIPEIPV